MLRKRIDLVLAAILLATTLTIGGVTASLHMREFGYDLVKGYTNYIKEGQPLASVSARISALTNTINQVLLGKDAFQKLNLRLQMALGKEMFSLGGSTMVRLKTGQLYDLQKKTVFTDDIEKMVLLKGNLEKMSFPMLYVYPHCSLFEDGLLPGGVVDTNVQMADVLVSGLREAGIPVVDSREVYRSSGLTLDQAIYRTDQHWANPLIFETFRATAAKLNEMGFMIDPSIYAEENFTTDFYLRMHMGQVGERLGIGLIEPDDFALIYPAYATSFTKKIVNGRNTEEKTGAFMDLLYPSLLEDAKENGVANLYWVYGNQDAENWYTNDKVSTGRILISKDSFGTPFVDFMALTAHEVLAVDLRKTARTIEDYAREYQPDIVIVAHSQAMLRSANYVFIEK